jgi:diguanylate cyclase (GGDEF)-like protein
MPAILRPIIRAFYVFWLGVQPDWSGAGSSDPRVASIQGLMSESTEAPSTQPVRASLIVRAAQIGLVLGLFVASLVGASAAIRWLGGGVVVAGSLLLLAGVLILLSIAVTVAREILHWRRPMRRLEAALEDIKDRAAPISDLDQVRGGAKGVVEPIKALVVELREQKKLYNELQDEIRARVSNRTDALERRLGALKNQAERDALSGLGNRRAIEVAGPRMFNEAFERNADLAVLMIDVDNFKPLNDTLGHAAGDQLLRGIGQIIRSTIPEGAAGFRLGGDEFVILVPIKIGGDVAALILRLEKVVDLLVKPLNLKHPPKLSIGTATARASRAEDFDAMLKAADADLYAIKAKRTNRVRRVA